MCVFFWGGGGVKGGRGHNSIIPCSLTQIQVKIIILIALPIFPLVLVPELGVANIIHKDHEEERKEKMRGKKKKWGLPQSKSTSCTVSWLQNMAPATISFFPSLLPIPIHSSNHMEYSEDGKFPPPPPPPPLFFFLVQKLEIFLIYFLITLSIVLCE